MADPVLAEAAALYGVTADDLTPLGAFESDVYAFDGPHGPSILKVIAEEHRLLEQVQGEVEWLLALREAEISVSAPLASETGEYVAHLAEARRVLVAFARAPGEGTRPPDWTAARLEAWGALLGQLQSHSRGWTPAGERRKTIAEQSYAAKVKEVMEDDPVFTTAALELIDAAAPFLTHGLDSGLIHADLHQHNLLLHDEKWTAIDFDDCGYGAYAFDLAMPLFYMLKAQRGVSAADAAERLLPPFLRGFRRHAPDPLGGAEAVAACLNLRQAELVVALHANTEDDQWTDYLREVERMLHGNVITGTEVLPVTELQRWLE